jgi:hypothetical protein
MNRRPIIRVLVTLFCIASLAGLTTGCTDSGGDGGSGSNTTEPTPNTDWRASMPKDELVGILLGMGISLPPDASKAEVVATLEQETGCGCFGATCGTGYCGHECGGCDETKGEGCYAGTCVQSGSCPEMDLNAATSTALIQVQVEAETQRFRYEAELEGKNLEMLRVMSNTTTVDAIGPGTYDLRLFDISACELCARAYRQCTDGVCGETYVATAGKVVIEKGVNGTTFLGSVEGLLFEQSYEDPKTGNVYVLGHSAVKRHCVGSLSMDTAIEETVIEPSDCNPDGNGVTIGSAIGDFQAENCLGELVNLHVGCGAKAMWVVAAAGW